MAEIGGNCEIVKLVTGGEIGDSVGECGEIGDSAGFTHGSLCDLRRNVFGC